MARRPPPRSILITGASSGIGAALAETYAEPAVRLLLGGRADDRLHAVAARCRHAGATVETAQIDVTDADAVWQWVETADDAGPLDLVIANAGISGGTGGMTAAGASTRGAAGRGAAGRGAAGRLEPAAQVRRLLAVNVDGVVNTVLPALPRMVGRGTGQVGVMASLAGFRGFPGAPTYCASKAAVRVWAEGLRDGLRGTGVGVTAICPGFVQSPMTDANDFPMPMRLPADRAARIIRRGLAADRARIGFPWPVHFSSWLLGALPPGWTGPLLGAMPSKPAGDG